MKTLNNRKEIEKRNEFLFKEILKMTKSDYFNKLASIGKPKGFGEGKWSLKNPTAGRCGSVINALRLSNRIPKGYIACGQNQSGGGSHYYLVNPATSEVIDPTCYQMDEDFIYENYHTKFLPQLSKNVMETLKALELVVDKNIFQIKTDSRGVQTISKKRK